MFSRATMRAQLFDGYEDALLSFLNSNLTRDIDRYVNLTSITGFKSPDIQLLGYFAAYNDTTDGRYVAYTGGSKPDSVGMIDDWRGWWRVSAASRCRLKSMLIVENRTLGWWRGSVDLVNETSGK